MHPTIPIHTMLFVLNICTSSCAANLSRERFVPFGRTFGAPYSNLPFVLIRYRLERIIIRSPFPQNYNEFVTLSLLIYKNFLFILLQHTEHSLSILMK